MGQGEDENRVLRCKPDDLAIVTRCGVLARVGLIVRVIERCNDDGYDWLVEVQGPGIVGRDVRSGRVCVCREALVHDWSLTPISGMDPPNELDHFEANRLRDKA